MTARRASQLRWAKSSSQPTPDSREPASLTVPANKSLCSTLTGHSLLNTWTYGCLPAQEPSRAPGLALLPVDFGPHQAGLWDLSHIPQSCKPSRAESTPHLQSPSAHTSPQQGFLHVPRPALVSARVSQTILPWTDILGSCLGATSVTIRIAWPVQIPRSYTTWSSTLQMPPKCPQSLHPTSRSRVHLLSKQNGQF